jgi:hypothetical protein
MSSLPPPLPPPPPPPYGGAGSSVPGDDWQLPGDKWLPAGYRVPPGRPGWQVNPLGWQDVAAPAPDPLVARDGFGDWWNKLFAAVGRSWRSLLPLHLVTLPLGVVAVAVLLPLRGALDDRGTTQPAIDRAAIVRSLAVLAVTAVLGLVASTVVKGASAWIITHDAAGEPTSWGAAVRFGLRRFWPFVGWSLATGLVTAVSVLACVLPAIWLGVIFGSVLTGVVAFERADTWQRCFTLAKRSWWALLGRLLIVGLVGGVAGAVIDAVTRAMLESDATAAVIASAVVSGVLRVPIAMLGASAAVVTYAERRAATGSCSTAELLDGLRR